LSIIGSLAGVLGGSGFLHYFFGWLGVSGPLLWPCVLSKMYPVAAAGIMLWRRGSFVVLLCEEGAWLPWCNWDVFNRERKNYDKTRMAGYERAKRILKMLYVYVW